MHKILTKEFVQSTLLLTAAIMLAYFPLFNNGFVNFDDTRFIIKNDWIRNLSWDHLKAMFSESKEGHYQPLTWILYTIEYQLFGLNTKGYHAVSLILHLVNTLLIFRFLRQVNIPYNTVLITSILYSVHPMLTEAIAWKSAQSTLLFSFFSLASLNAYLKTIPRSKPGIWLMISYLLFLLACLSKSQAIVVPALWLITHVYLTQNFKLKPKLHLIPGFLLSLVFVWMAINAAKTFGSLDSVIEKYTVLDRLFLVAYACFFYIQKIGIPIQYSAVHFNPLKINHLLPYYFYLMPLFLILFWGFMYRFLNGKKYVVLYFLLFYAISIAPVAQIISVGNTIAAERYGYLSSIPIVFVFVLFFQSIKITAWLQKSLLMLVFAGLLYQTHERIKVWNNNFLLYSDMIEKYPNQFYAYYAFGVTLNEMGLYQNALQYLHIGDSLNHQSSKINHTFGLVYHNLNQYDSAIQRFSKAIAFDLHSSDAYYNRGITYIKMGEKQKAIQDLSISLNLKPNNILALKNRALLKYESFDFHGALRDIEWIERISGSNSEIWINKARIYKKLNQPELALKHYQLFLNSNPRSDAVFFEKALYLIELGQLDEAQSTVDILKTKNIDTYELDSLMQRALN